MYVCWMCRVTCALAWALPEQVFRSYAYTVATSAMYVLRLSVS